MKTTPRPTADLADAYGDRLRVCDVQFTSYVAVRSFAGRVQADSCQDDNALLHELLRVPGDGCVVVVDGGASLRSTAVPAGKGSGRVRSVRSVDQVTVGSPLRFDDVPQIGVRVCEIAAPVIHNAELPPGDPSYAVLADLDDVRTRQGGQQG